jgi:exosortase J
MPALIGDKGEPNQKNMSRLLPWLVLGFTGLLLTTVSLLWRIWTNDALRSIGVFFPIISVVLVLRVWRRMEWEARGTWWGLVPLYFATVMARAGGNALQLVAFTRTGGFTLLPLGLTIFAFGSGVVLLLGGFRLWRSALFPLLLLLFVNPVPAAFQLIDLPLQFFCARVAHLFALAIGAHPDVNQLQMMFTPGFGMFIAPGCDGIRGAVTMGYLALVLGYLYELSVATRVLSSLAAVALGYLFNLIRLCSLVLFYRVALSFPSLQPHGLAADYLIGGILFLVAAALFTIVLRRKNQGPRGQIPARLEPRSDDLSISGKGALHWKGAVVSLLVIFASISSVRDLTDMATGSVRNGYLETLLPQQIGEYRMLRTWSEQDWLGRPAYRWVAYSKAGSDNQVNIAFWLGPGVHYPLACHVSRGQRPAWEQVSALSTAQSGSATFALQFYEESPGQVLEATTVCDGGGCNQHQGITPDTGLAFASMGIASFLFRPVDRPTSIIIRTQPLTNPSNDGRHILLSEMRDFVAGLDTQKIVKFAGSRNNLRGSQGQ